MPQLYMIVPVGFSGERPDNSLPGSGWSGPVDPGWGWGGGEHPGNRPPGSYPGGHPGNRPPGSWDGTHPGNRPPGSWDGTHPGNRPPGSWTGERPDNSLPEVMPQGGTEVPPEVYTPAPIPEEIISQYVVTVYNPKTQTYTTKTYPPR